MGITMTFAKFHYWTKTSANAETQNPFSVRLSGRLPVWKQEELPVVCFTECFVENSVCVVYTLDHLWDIPTSSQVKDAAP